MIWPFKRRRPEARENFTSLVTTAAIDSAAGTAASGAGATAGLEIAAGTIGRCFAAATVRGGPDNIRAAVDPGCLHLLGRELIRTGEAVFVIEVRDGRVELLPCWTWDVYGGVSPRDWTYRADLYGATTNRTLYLPAAGVLHFRLNVSPGYPYIGLSPLSVAALAGTLSAAVSEALRDEAGGPRGSAFPVPASPETDADDDPMAPLRNAIATARGRLLTVEAAPDTADPGRGARLYEQARIGADPPSGLVGLFTAACLEVVAVCGVPPALASAEGNAQAGRESWRRLWAGTVAPMARIVEAELRRKLDPAIELRFTELAAHDISGRARAFKAMVDGGMALDAAAAASGVLLTPEA